jgi:hypothetical protein
MIRVPGTVLLCLALVVSCFSVTTTTPLPPPVGITLVGKGEVSGTALDKSGLTGNICQASAPANCVPKAIFVGFGSDLTYTGHDNVFIAAPDRGPFDRLTDSKTLFIDLLDPVFSLAATIPEKIEGLAWGPDLPDSRHLLYVISDNDLNPSLATQIYAFAIDPSLINLEPQNLSGPPYPPGQVKRR